MCTHLFAVLYTLNCSRYLFSKSHRLHILQFTDLIGEGAFSCVYRGSYQGSEVAVKQLKIPLSSQDKNYFAAEVHFTLHILM